MAQGGLVLWDRARQRFRVVRSAPVPDELRERATAVVLTAPYHERDAPGLGLPVHTPPADTWQDWVEKFGIDPDRVRGMESEDIAWLRAVEAKDTFTVLERGRSASTRTRAARTTISSSGSRRSVRSSPATGSPTSATDWTSGSAIAST